MIAVNTTGGVLTPAFIELMEQSWLDPTLKPVDTILFSRKIGATWYNRDVSALWIDQDPVEKHLARQYGASEGTQTNFYFRNTPITTLRNSYFGGTELEVVDTTFGEDFSFAVGDWIAVSSFDNETEFRRITEVYPTLIRISEALDNIYPAGDNQDMTEIRFAFIREPTANRIDPQDEFNGWLYAKTGFTPLSERVNNFLGRVNAGIKTPDDRVVITAQDRLKELVGHELSARFEVDDRGVASVPTANSTNQGSGTISDVRYHPKKLPDQLTTETWTLTYKTDSLDVSGNTVHGWELSGSVSGVVGVNGPLPQHGGEVDWLSTGEIGGRTWFINGLGAAATGFALTISEGDVPFASGDTFRVYTQASGTIVAVKGEGYGSNPIDTTNLAQLYPSHVVEYIIVELLGWVHENPELVGNTPLITNASLFDVQQLPQDFFTELRGGFYPKGTRIIEITDDALKPVLGWLGTTEDDHLFIFYYSPAMLNSPTNLNLSFDKENNDTRKLNVLSCVSEPYSVESVRNRVHFRHEGGEVEVDDATSQATHGVRTLTLRAEDYTNVPLQTRFLVDESSLRAAADRILLRVKDPLHKLTMECHPNLLLIELGDTPKCFARAVQFSNRRLWVTGIRKNLKRRIVEIECEDAVHLQGKYAKYVDDGTDPAVATIWDSSGFIGNAGEERLGIYGDETDQLDVVGNNDGDYDAKLGKPGQWGTDYVEDNYVYW